MTPRRAVPVLLAALLALVAATFGPATADAAWSTSGSGSARARAGTLAAPAGIATGTMTCSLLTASLPVTWAASPGAVSYQVEVASSSLFGDGTTTATTAGPSYTVTRTFLSALGSTNVWVRARAVAGTWVGPYSATASGTLGPCLL